jgi:type IV pilus assembly protein PilF
MSKTVSLVIVPAIVAAGVLAAACVSTTTGSVPPETSDKEAAQNYYQLGTRYYRNGKYDFARARLERAVELDPGHAEAHSTLALTYVKLDNLRLATEHYDRSVRIAPNNANVRNAYAVFLCQRRRFDEAEQQFARALAIVENDDPEIVLTNAGVCVTQKPDIERAETYFRKALDEKPGYGEALLQMSLLKREQNDNLAARAFLQRYFSTNPATAPVLYLALQVERELGDDRASGEYALRLLQEFPKSLEARYVREGR